MQAAVRREDGRSGKQEGEDAVLLCCATRTLALFHVARRSALALELVERLAECGHMFCFVVLERLIGLGLGAGLVFVRWSGRLTSDPCPMQAILGIAMVNACV